MSIDPDDYITEGNSPGKYLRLEVTDFDGQHSTTSGARSYLHLGVPYDGGLAPDVSGDDLATLVAGFADDTRDRGNPGDQPAAPQASVDPRSPIPTSVLFDPSPDVRGMESRKLHLKGGWRDHSDGNRITTTRGDKVEVIRGNYKLLVLGRQDDPKAAAGWDVSGGLVDNVDLGNDPPAVPNRFQSSITYQWEQDTDQRWGWTQTTQIGVEDTTSKDAQDHKIAGNGRLVAITYVDRITQTYGSALKPVDSITVTTHANQVTATTYATGDSTTEFHARNVNTFNHATHAIQNQNWAAGDISTSNIAASMAEFDFAAISAILNLVAVVAEIKGGIHADIHGALHLDVHAVAHIEQHLGPHLQFSGLSEDFSVSKNEITDIHTEIIQARTSIQKLKTMIGDTDLAMYKLHSLG